MPLWHDFRHKRHFPVLFRAGMSEKRAMRAILRVSAAGVAPRTARIFVRLRGPDCPPCAAEAGLQPPLPGRGGDVTVCIEMAFHAFVCGIRRPEILPACARVAGMDDVIAEVNRALRARGWSAQYASRQLGGSPEFIRNLRRGYVSSIEKFRNLCEILGLEFYVGPKREPGAIDERRLERTIATLERVLLEKGFVLEPEDKAGAVAALYALALDESSPVATARVQRMLSAMTRGRRGSGEEAED